MPGPSAAECLAFADIRICHKADIAGALNPCLLSGVKRT